VSRKREHWGGEIKSKVGPFGRTTCPCPTLSQSFQALRNTSSPSLHFSVPYVEATLANLEHNICEVDSSYIF